MTNTEDGPSTECLNALAEEWQTHDFSTMDARPDLAEAKTRAVIQEAFTALESYPLATGCVEQVHAAPVLTRRQAF
jgi:hypothetical protein